MVHVRSRDGMQKTSGYNTDFSVMLNQPLKLNDGEYFLMSLSSAQIPYSFYNVQADLNNRIIVNGEEIFLTPANYNVNTFAEEVSTKINMKMTFQKNTGKYQYVALQNLTMILESDSPLAQLGLDEGTYFLAQNSTMWSNNAVNMYSFNSLYLRTPNLFSLNSLESRHGGYSDILSKIEIQSSPSEFIYYLQHNNHRSLLKQRVITQLDVRLTGTNNHLIYLNGCSWEFSVQFDIIKENDEIPVGEHYPSIPRLISNGNVYNDKTSRKSSLSQNKAKRRKPSEMAEAPRKNFPADSIDVSQQPNDNRSDKR